MKLAMVIVDGFQDHEFSVPYNELTNKGHTIDIVSTTTGVLTGKLGSTMTAVQTMEQTQMANYDGIIFIGGPGARVLIENIQAHILCMEAVEQGKLLAAICIAPCILARAGVLKGVKATVWSSSESIELLTEMGAGYYNKDVVTDNKIITANGPNAAEKFTDAILAIL